MRSDGTKKSPVRMLVYLLLLAAVVALGYFTDIVDFTELKAVFSLKLTALLKLAVMVLLVLLVSNLVIFILHGIKPRTHRGGSVLSLLSSLVKYVAGIIIVCQSLSLLGVNVGTIIASVGVLALVVGFSAESLIADVVIGAFMLLENQYNVGDIVEVNGFRGVVTKIGIRTTSITDMIAKLGPMFGLLGTLIPLGPGIVALGQGDTVTLSESMNVAFDTTIAGVISAAVASVISHIRKRWYNDDMVSLETLMEAVLEEVTSDVEG